MEVSCAVVLTAETTNDVDSVLCENQRSEDVEREREHTRERRARERTRLEGLANA